MKILGLLADGLRSDFGSTVRPVTQTLVGKCKEKKLTSEVQGALGLVLLYAVPFEALIEDVAEHIRNKKVRTRASCECSTRSDQSIPVLYKYSCGNLLAMFFYPLFLPPLLSSYFYHPCHPQVPPHGRVCMMDFLQAALSSTSPLEARSRVGSESMKPLAEALIACCEDSDPKV